MRIVALSLSTPQPKKVGAAIQLDGSDPSSRLRPFRLREAQDPTASRNEEADEAKQRAGRNGQLKPAVREWIRHGEPPFRCQWVRHSGETLGPLKQNHAPPWRKTVFRVACNGRAHRAELGTAAERPRIRGDSRVHHEQVPALA